MSTIKNLYFQFALILYRKFANGLPVHLFLSLYLACVGLFKNEWGAINKTFDFKLKGKKYKELREVWEAAMEARPFHDWPPSILHQLEQFQRRAYARPRFVPTFCPFVCLSSLVVRRCCKFGVKAFVILIVASTSNYLPQLLQDGFDPVLLISLVFRQSRKYGLFAITAH